MKFFYWCGIYSICILIHETANYIAVPLDAEIKRKFKKRNESIQKEERHNKSKNLTTGEVGDPINRIGF